MPRVLGRAVPVTAVGTVAALAVFLALAGDAPSVAAQSGAGQAPAQQAEYVGSDLCAECHTNQADTFLTSVHSGLDWEHSEWPFEVEEGLDIRCEACHGPGSTHVEMAGTQQAGFREAIISFAKEAPLDTSEQCLNCHLRMEEQQHFRVSEHTRVGLTCADCHNPHQPVSVEYALRAPEPGLCYQCHGDKRGEFAMPVRHPVNEGFMTCSDCHSPHGSANRVQLRRVGNDTCADCHVEKEGPFVFPHVAAEAEGCATCHSPHGSVTPHLLVKADIALVCYQCHQAPFGLAPPSFHREDSRGVCTECHHQIHGSNLDPKFMR